MTEGLLYMGVKANGESDNTTDASSTEDELTNVITAAMGTLETKLMDYLTTNVAPIVAKVKQIEATLSQGNSATEVKEPTTVEARLAQLEREKQEAEVERKRSESEGRLKSAIAEALTKSGHELEEVDFLKDTLYNQLYNQAEDTEQSGWLVKGTGKTASEYVTDFLQKPTGKRFIKVATVPGSGTPEPKSTASTAKPTSINDIITQTIW